MLLSPEALAAARGLHGQWPAFDIKTAGALLAEIETDAMASFEAERLRNATIYWPWRVLCGAARVYEATWAAQPVQLKEVWSPWHGADRDKVLPVAWLGLTGSGVQLPDLARTGRESKLLDAWRTALNEVLGVRASIRFCTAILTPFTVELLEHNDKEDRDYTHVIYFE